MMLDDETHSGAIRAFPGTARLDDGRGLDKTLE